MTVARRNAQVIVQYTTAYPFKLPECSLVCVYCQESLPTTQFRTHMETQHQEFKIRVAFAHLNEGYIKVDCTDLKCRTCLEKFDTIEDAANHLVSAHKRSINLNFDLGVQPFKFENEQLICAMCPMKFATLRTLSRHTQSHFRKCTCEMCGKSYLTSSSLQHHMRFTHSISSEQRICEKCRMVFDSPDLKRKHVSESPKCWRYSCKICFERFMSPTLRNAHHKEAHGIDKRSYVCPECKMVFPDMMRYRVHFKINHTDEFFACACGRKFESKYHLEKHRVSHTKERLFSCPECSKTFPRKHTLIGHMWIHSENKRFECKLCNKPFNQKVSWKTHMKSYHPELVDF